MSTFVTIVISHRVLGQPRFKSYLFCNVNQPKQPTSFWIPDKLSRINEIKTSLQGSDREEVSKKLDEMNHSLRIIEGNQADFSDAMFKAVERMQKSVEDSLKL